MTTGFHMILSFGLVAIDKRFRSLILFFLPGARWVFAISVWLWVLGKFSQCNGALDPADSVRLPPTIKHCRSLCGASSVVPQPVPEAHPTLIFQNRQWLLWRRSSHVPFQFSDDRTHRFSTQTLVMSFFIQCVCWHSQLPFAQFCKLSFKISAEKSSSIICSFRTCVRENFDSRWFSTFCCAFTDRNN